MVKRRIRKANYRPLELFIRSGAREEEQEPPRRRASAREKRGEKKRETAE